MSKRHVVVASQTRLGSFIEAWANVLIGFGINFTANLLILPLFGFTSLTIATNFVIGLIYTVISVVRSYVIRRWFNERLHKMAAALAKRIEK
jgi:hypothetical protein